jgi:pimeloyl-ACP methyl ester carboxylesterase
MSSAQIALLVAMSLPLLVLGLVSLGVGATAVFAGLMGFRDPRDPLQARLTAERRANLLSRAVWIVIEGFWQTIAFVLQGVHLIRRRLPPPPPRCPEATPVILLAGYLENSGLMYVLGTRLRRRGFVVIHRDLPSTLRAIDSNARWLSDEVKAVLASSGAERVAIVAHSMGGVIARTLVHQDPCAPVSVVVSIASPHRGTHMGRLGLGPSARDMTPGSDHCKLYPTPRAPACVAPPVHSIVGIQENIVSPYWSSILDGEGENVVLDVPCGHVAPLFMTSVLEQVVTWLDAAGVKRAGAAPSSSAAVAA